MLPISGNINFLSVKCENQFKHSKTPVKEIFTRLRKRFLIGGVLRLRRFWGQTSFYRSSTVHGGYGESPCFFIGVSFVMEFYCAYHSKDQAE